MNENFCKSIANMVLEKNVVIYGAGNQGALMLNIMDVLGKKVLYFLDKDSTKQKEGFCGYKVKAPEEILYENMSETIVVIAVGMKKEIEKYLTELGLKEGVEFIHGATLRYDACDAIDPLLGYSRSADINGFKVIGNYNEKNRSIICLGGSTTDYSLFGIKSWSEYLFEICSDVGLNLNILNGGVIGYNSSQELLKLIRDGLELNPFLVISYSGVNDLGFIPMMGSKYLYEILENLTLGNSSKSILLTDDLAISNGIRSRWDSAEYWYRNERIMCSICRGYEIPFLGILQPSVFTKRGGLSLYEQRAYEEAENRERREEQFEKAKQLVNTREEKDIVDLTFLFDEYKDIYIDCCHVFEQGNKLIAESIYKIIKNRQILA